MTNNPSNGERIFAKHTCSLVGQLVGVYGTSNLVGYLMPNHVHIKYMICKRILC